MIKITWLELNASYAHSSLSLPSLHAQTLNEGAESSFEWVRVSGTLKSREVDLVQELIDSEPDVLLATAWLFTHDLLLRVVGRYKALRPQVVVVFGGAEFLGDNRGYLENYGFVDAVFRGEGDLFLIQWGGMWSDRSKWSEVKGLCFLDHKRDYHDGGRARIETFERLIAPERSHFFPLDKAFVQMETTRGCFNSCAFCVSGGDRPVRRLSLPQIEEKLAYYVAKGIRQVRVLDRTFNASIDFAVQLLQLFQRFDGRLSFHLEIHPALLTDRLCELLRSMPNGLLHLEAGMQSLSDSVLQASGRSGDSDKALQGLRFLFSLDNMETHTDLIAGLPCYTFEQTISDVRTLVRMRAGEIQLESLKLLPGTAMRASADRLGLRFSPTPPYEVLATESLTYSQLQSLLTLSRLLDLYYNHSIWQNVFIDLVAQDDDLLPMFIAYFRDHRYDGQLLSQEKQGAILGHFMEVIHSKSFFILQRSWIDQGLPLGKLPAMQSTRTIKGEELESLGVTLSCYSRGYEVITKDTRWVVIYDRAVDQSLPIWVSFEELF